MRSWMIGLVLGLLPVALLPSLPGFGAIVLLACTGMALLCLRGTLPRFCSGLAIGCVLALDHGSSLLDRRLSGDCVGQPLEASGVVASLPRSSQMPDGTPRQRFEFRVDSISPPICQGPGRVLLSYYGEQRMVPGDRWRFQLKLSKPWGLANPGSFNMQSWYAQTRIDAVGSVRGDSGVRLEPRAALVSLPDRLRQSISDRIARLPMGADVVAILAAITVADKSGIDSGLWTLLQHFGINHLLVISGLHVGLVAGAGYLLGNLAARPLLLIGLSVPQLPAGLALIFCTAYTALAGFSVSTQRALCMLLCFIAAGLVNRNSSPTNNLLLAAVLVLVLNPLAGLGSGFWLSFSAVAALLWLARWQGGQPPWKRLAGTHLFMSLVMLPMGAWWFGGSSLVAAVANLLMVPLVGLVVVPLALLAVVSIYLLPMAEPLLWRAAGWPLQLLLPHAERLVAANGDWLYYSLPALLPEVALAVVGAALLILPGSMYRRTLAALLLVPLLLPVGSGTDGTRPAPDSEAMHVTVLDVGQGTAVVIRVGGRALLYDTGGGDPAGTNMGGAVVLPYLRGLGLNSLDTLVISHWDNDHSAGAATVLHALQPGQFYSGGRLGAPGAGRPCIAGLAWRWPGGQRFQFLSPGPAEQLDSNDGSCVLQIESGGHRLLLTGDIESGRERDLVRYWGGALESEWLLLAHHGSQTSSTHALLKTVRPRIAVLSRGYANRFGHPHASVLERLELYNTSIFDTAIGGALEFKFAPGEVIQVRQYRQQVKRFWM